MHPLQHFFIFLQFYQSIIQVNLTHAQQFLLKLWTNLSMKQKQPEPYPKNHASCFIKGCMKILNTSHWDLLQVFTRNERRRAKWPNRQVRIHSIFLKKWAWKWGYTSTHLWIEEILLHRTKFSSFFKFLKPNFLTFSSSFQNRENDLFVSHCPFLDTHVDHVYKLYASINALGAENEAKCSGMSTISQKFKEIWQT